MGRIIEKEYVKNILTRLSLKELSLIKDKKDPARFVCNTVKIKYVFLIRIMFGFNIFQKEPGIYAAEVGQMACPGCILANKKLPVHDVNEMERSAAFWIISRLMTAMS
ncbi:hypothetical protein [Weizmannia acidilactici]|uniref:hypothetical protein n=2 Tax=Weizmannia acidilactici TaxID=2607726 RepID=UPI00124C5497|nr:hypothetical protein [Weizmannia acidilactici]